MTNERKGRHDRRGYVNQLGDRRYMLPFTHNRKLIKSEHSRYEALGLAVAA